MINKLGINLNPHEGKYLYDFLKDKALKLKYLKHEGIYPHESKTKHYGIFLNPKNKEE